MEQVKLTGKQLKEYIDKEADKIITSLLESRKRNKKRINEGGHLYGHNEDGTPFTNSKETWRGVKGTTFISHGEWSDPEIWYKGKELNANDIEDGLWSWYQEECSENGEQPTEQGYEQWMETQDLAGYLDDVLFGMNESKQKKYISDKLTNYVVESFKRKTGASSLNEDTGNGLYSEIRFVQGGDDDYNEIERMFCGEEDAYCEGNSQPVIDYLAQWDSDENNLTTNQPRIARYDTSYSDENGVYTLLYNSSVGGCFLLYRNANEKEIDWYEQNGSQMSESKLRENVEQGEDILNMVRSMRSNVLDLSEDGYGILHVDYDPQTNELYAGYATNTGIPKNFSIQYDTDFSLDENLQALVEEIYNTPVNESVKKTKKKYIYEAVSYDDFGTISEVLEQCGWAYSDAYEVRNRKTGQMGMRYVIEPYPNNLNGTKPCDLETLKQKIIEFVGQENVIFSEGQHVQAPEIKNMSMVIIDNE